MIGRRRHHQYGDAILVNGVGVGSGGNQLSDDISVSLSAREGEWGQAAAVPRVGVSASH